MIDAMCYAIIPARRGSKGLPNKNIRILHGKPLIAWSILCAKAVKSLDRTVVSTDSEEIASVAREYECDIIRRPDELATDAASSIDVLIHALDVIGAHDRDVAVLLQPTSPLRSTDDVEKAISLHRASNGSSIISVSEPRHNPYWNMMIGEGRLVPLLGEKYLQLRRQDLPQVVAPNGAIYVASVRSIRTHRSFYTNDSKAFIMPQERGVDIDSKIDLSLAEILMSDEG